jgi:hypothetical protein
LTERKRTKAERLRTIIKKPYVRIPLILGILLYTGFVIVLIFVAVGSLYVLGTLVGVPTLQLLTGAVSAGSAVASASAAILIWRGNARARKTALLDRVLGPTYSEVRRNRELLESWKTEPKDLALITSFLKQAGSDWLYYTIDSGLREDLERFKTSVATLEQQRDLCKSVAGPIIIKAASSTFGVKDVSTVYLWRSHSWTEGQKQGDFGSMPIWELVVDSSPLQASRGYYVHSLQLVDFNGVQQETFPLLSTKKERLNVDTFQQFWESARQLASTESVILEFRKLWREVLDDSSNLEQKLDSEIRRLR